MSAPTALDRLITEIKREIAQADESAVRHAIRAGELLIEAKALVRHGEWTAWLKANFGKSARTAENYMRFAQNRNAVADFGSVREADRALRKRPALQFEVGANDDLDPAAHWEAAAMPEYHDTPQDPRIMMSFDTEADQDEFWRLNGEPTIQNKTGGTWSIRWPSRPKDDVKSVRFEEVDE